MDMSIGAAMGPPASASDACWTCAAVPLQPAVQERRCRLSVAVDRPNISATETAASREEGKEEEGKNVVSVDPSTPSVIYPIIIYALIAFIRRFVTILRSPSTTIGRSVMARSLPTEIKNKRVSRVAIPRAGSGRAGTPGARGG